MDDQMNKARYKAAPTGTEPTTGSQALWIVLGFCVAASAIMGTIKLGMVLFS